MRNDSRSAASTRDANEPRVVLASRSPRRKELLEAIVGERLVIQPPSSPGEPGFDDVSEKAEIERLLLQIVQMKHDDVQSRLDRGLSASDQHPIIIAADTIVIAGSDAEQRLVLGQPHADRWQQDVREWFEHWLSGRTHEVWTGVRISRANALCEFVTKSLVTFDTVSDELLDWYISTGESPGKAGGYAIQGHAAVFVRKLQGSLTNVIGLPVMEVLEGLMKLGWRRNRP